MFIRTIAACFAMSASTLAFAGISSVDLSKYQVTQIFDLPSAASEASAITFNWNNGNLFVLGDEGDAIVEISRTGSVISTMNLTGFDDTEGLSYIGGGQFVLTEERLQDAYLLNYAAGGNVARSSLSSVSLGPTVGNIGIEGISYDPSTGSYFAVKEKGPQAVYEANINFGTGSVVLNNLFTPALGVSDLSDIQVLSTVPSLIGTADQNNLLIFSQESASLLEVSRAGNILSQFSFAGLSDSAEGVTIDSDGFIYIADETPRVFVLSPVPEPETYAMMIIGLGLVTLAVKCKRS